MIFKPVWFLPVILMVPLACTGVSQSEFDRVSRELSETKDELNDAKIELLISVPQKEFDNVSVQLNDARNELVDTKAELLSLRQDLSEYQQTAESLLELQKKHEDANVRYEDLRSRATEVSHLIEFFVVSYQAEVSGDYSKLGQAMSLFGSVEDVELQSLVGALGDFENMSEAEVNAVMIAIFNRMTAMLE